MKQLIELESSKNHSHNNTFQISTDVPSIRQEQPHAKYGRLVVLFENDRFLITLGPDYPCFITAFIIFCILNIFTLIHVFNVSQNGFLRAAYVLGAIFQLFIYAYVATSNPGIATKTTLDTEEETEASKTQRFCRHCNIPMLPKSRHCSFCQVCIKGYDHHCPWTSKCIGQNNIIRFYIFCAYVPTYLVCCIIGLTLQV